MQSNDIGRSINVLFELYCRQTFRHEPRISAIVLN